MLKGLVKAKRVELLSGGFYEPILTVLPERDRPLQVRELSRFISDKFVQEPKGMWLAERVWEPQMPKYIADAGIEYLPIDDYHFKLIGLEDEDLFGYYMTEDEGRVVNVFPGSEKLRYFIPFRTIEETISYFREVHEGRDNPLLTMADDGEKFGVWPNTYKHCYEDGWLDRFFTALEENSDWIETTTFSEYYQKFRPLGRVYLPTASYREMGEWSLPPDRALEYEHLLEELQKTAGERAKQLIRGGIWRSFFAKYPESNHIHKRMCMISSRVHEACAANPKKGREALAELWKGQCNDAYWHGIFGGLYLPHLRSALSRHLIRAESAANAILKDHRQALRADFDCDGNEEIIIGNEQLLLVVSEEGGSLAELSFRKQAVNILDILTRRREAYHAKVEHASDASSADTKTIHDQLTVKEEGLAEFLVYDPLRRRSLLDRFIPAGTTLDQIASSEADETGDFVSGIYEMSMRGGKRSSSVVLSREGMAGRSRVNLQKSIDIKTPGRIKVSYSIDGPFEGQFAVEVNLSLLGSPYSLIKAGGHPMQMRSKAEHRDLKEFSIEDSFLDLFLRFRFDSSITLWHYPVETISLSEQGVERLYQGTSFLFLIRSDEKEKMKFAFTVEYGEVNE